MESQPRNSKNNKINIPNSTSEHPYRKKIKEAPPPPRKKIKLTKKLKESKLELEPERDPSLAITVGKVNLEGEDYPSKHSSKKSKRKKLEQESREILSALPIPVENIKRKEENPPSNKSKKIKRQGTGHTLEVPEEDVSKLPQLPVPVEIIKFNKEGSDDINMHFNSSDPTPEEIEKEEDNGETDKTVDSEKRSKNKRRKEKTKETETQYDAGEFEWKTAKLFPCRIDKKSCHLAFRTAKKLKKHLEDVHGHGQCKFPECLKFIELSEMNRHLKSEHSEGSELISRNEKGKENGQHMEHNHGETMEYTCKVCHQIYFSKFPDEKRALKNHLKKKCPIPGAIRLRCKTCKIVFPTKKERRNHDCNCNCGQTETPVKSVKCVYSGCGDLFPNELELNAHAKSTRHWKLLSHDLFYTLQFSTGLTFPLHDGHENSDHVFRCIYDSCTETFSKQKFLRVHARVAHSRFVSPLLFSCEPCKIVFKGNESLENHVLGVHKNKH